MNIRENITTETNNRFLPCMACGKICSLSEFAYETIIKNPLFVFICSGCSKTTEKGREVIVIDKNVLTTISTGKPSIDPSTGHVCRSCPGCGKVIVHKGKYADVNTLHAIKIGRLCISCGHSGIKRKIRRFDKIPEGVWYDKKKQLWRRKCPKCNGDVYSKYKNNIIESQKRNRKCSDCQVESLKTMIRKPRLSQEQIKLNKKTRQRRYYLKNHERLLIKQREYNKKKI
jgi:hypothetical protein